MNEADLDFLFNGMVHHENFEESETEIETFESIEGSKEPQECNSDPSNIFLLADLIGKKEGSQTSSNVYKF